MNYGAHTAHKSVSLAQLSFKRIRKNRFEIVGNLFQVVCFYSLWLSSLERIEMKLERKKRAPNTHTQRERSDLWAHSVLGLRGLFSTLFSLRLELFPTLGVCLSFSNSLALSLSLKLFLSLFLSLGSSLSQPQLTNSAVKIVQNFRCTTSSCGEKQLRDNIKMLQMCYNLINEDQLQSAAQSHIFIIYLAAKYS